MFVWFDLVKRKPWNLIQIKNKKNKKKYKKRVKYINKFIIIYIKKNIFIFILIK